jgi:hypothetical protein
MSPPTTSTPAKATPFAWPAESAFEPAPTRPGPSFFDANRADRGHHAIGARCDAAPVTARPAGRALSSRTVSLVVHLPEDLSARVETVAAPRGLSAEEVVAEAVAAHLPAPDDPLEAFIGSGSSGRDDLARRHRAIRAELTGGLTARER